MADPLSNLGGGLGTRSNPAARLGYTMVFERRGQAYENRQDSPRWICCCNCCCRQGSTTSLAVLTLPPQDRTRVPVLTRAGRLGFRARGCAVWKS